VGAALAHAQRMLKPLSGTRYFSKTAARVVDKHPLVAAPAIKGGLHAAIDLACVLLGAAKVLEPLIPSELYCLGGEALRARPGCPIELWGLGVPKKESAS